MPACAASRNITSVISGTSCGSPERTTAGAPIAALAGVGYRSSSASATCLRGVRVRDREPAERAAVLDHVDRAPVGQVRDREADDPCERRLVVQRRRQRRARLGEEREPLLRRLRLRAGDVLAGQQPDPLLLGVLALDELPDLAADCGHRGSRSASGCARLLKNSITPSTSLPRWTGRRARRAARSRPPPRSAGSWGPAPRRRSTPCASCSRRGRQADASRQREPSAQALEAADVERRRACSSQRMVSRVVGEPQRAEVPLEALAYRPEDPKRGVLERRGLRQDAGDRVLRGQPLLGATALRDLGDDGANADGLSSGARTG